MRDLNGDAVGTEAVQKFQRVFHRHPKAGGERWCRDQRRRGEHVDGDGGA